MKHNTHKEQKTNMRDDCFFKVLFYSDIDKTFASTCTVLGKKVYSPLPTHTHFTNVSASERNHDMF